MKGPCRRIVLGLVRMCLGALVFFGAGPGLCSDYLRVEGPCAFSFPRDHGAHPGYQTEWWYYTGNVQGPSGRPFGFQLTFFRRQIVPPGTRGRPVRPSAWRVKDLFMAHAALSDIHDGRFYWDEDVARGAVGLAGVRESGGAVAVFVGPWKAVMDPSGHRLTARTDAFSFDLTALPLKAPVAHGNGGYSRKGRRPQSASCYYSLTRLDTRGRVSVGEKVYPVTGTAWMDHEYSTAPLEPSLAGWDWFSLQLTDGSELMLYILRQKDGAADPASSGTFIPAQGPTRHLTREAFEVSVMGWWQSPGSMARYPSQWRIRVLPVGLDLEVSPRLSEQELRLAGPMKVSYWEGSVGIKGRRGGRVVGGVGYVELTGYAAPFDLLGHDRPGGGDP
jgi:predicted secreted hydrolase